MCLVFLGLFPPTFPQEKGGNVTSHMPFCQKRNTAHQNVRTRVSRFGPAGQPNTGRGRQPVFLDVPLKFGRVEGVYRTRFKKHLINNHWGFAWPFKAGKCAV